jgi:predicted branched-subunit amino acid permease
VSLAQSSHRARTLGFWVTGIGIYIGWNLSTLAGALLGDVLGDPRSYGLDAAAAAAFLALLWPRLRARQPIVVGVAAAIVATVLTPVLMPGMPVIIAAAVAIVVGWSNWLGTDDAADGAEPEDAAQRRAQEPWEGLP